MIIVMLLITIRLLVISTAVMGTALCVIVLLPSEGSDLLTRVVSRSHQSTRRQRPHPGVAVQLHVQRVGSGVRRHAHALCVQVQSVRTAAAVFCCYGGGGKRGGKRCCQQLWANDAIHPVHFRFF